MGLNINKVRQSGFTIVELLIVVVVIAILAAITIVSYNGITTQANASAAKATASTFQKKVELYYSELNYYPDAAADLSADTSKPYYLPATGINFAAEPGSGETAVLKASNGKNNIRVKVCPNSATGSGVVGLRIFHYNYEGSGEAAPIDVGVTTSCS